MTCVKAHLTALIHFKGWWGGGGGLVMGHSVWYIQYPFEAKWTNGDTLSSANFPVDD